VSQIGSFSICVSRLGEEG